MNLHRILMIMAVMAAVLCFPLLAGAEDGDDEGCDHWNTYYEKINAEYHREVCLDCKTVISDRLYHSFDFGDCVKIDGSYHATKYECYDCGAVVYQDKERHSWGYGEYSRLATLSRKAIVYYTCYGCWAETTSYPSWKLNTDYSISYNITSHSPVYKTSKSITVKLERPVKGSVIKVKIGKKTYKKKVSNTSKKQKVKIKKSKYGQKVSINLYYKGKKIGIDNCAGDYIDDHVLYGKKVKKGMTKKKVKCLYYWGPPYDTASSSGGWSYWYYYDGSSITFKNGKVRYWYDAE